MPHANGNDSGGRSPSRGPGPTATATATNGSPAIAMAAMQSHFGDCHQQQQNQQKNNAQINNYLQHHSFANNQLQPSHQHQSLATPQQQQFLQGPFHSLQQQQAFTQARLTMTAQLQTQQWQQQLARVQFQAQQHQQQAQVQGGTTIAGAKLQHNLRSLPLVGQPQTTNFGSGVEVASQSQLSPNSSTPTAVAMHGMHAALDFTTNAPDQCAETLMAKPAALHACNAPSAYPIAETAATTTSFAPAAMVAGLTRKRSSCTPSQLTAKSTSNDGNKCSKSAKYPLIAPKQKQIETSTGGQLQPSDSCVSSGISSSAAKLIQNAMDESNTFEIPSECSTLTYGDDPSTEQKKQSSRDRNREHARCTRLRKKAYVDKLKELVDGLHAERNEDARKRRAAVQRLAEVQELRRKVVNTFLEYHCSFESDYNKWKLIIETGGKKNDDDAEEEAFWMKQPVTPYRSFRRCEIQKGSRILKGIDALIRDSASMAVMIDTIGSRNIRWLQRKRDDFLAQHSSKRNHAESLTHRTHRAANKMVPTLPRTVCPNRQAQHAISSLSSCSGSSTEFGSSSEEEWRLAQRPFAPGKSTVDKQQDSSNAAKNVTSSSSSGDTNQQLSSNDFHDYNASSLPDPLPRSGDSSSSIADCIDSDNCVAGKQMWTDSSSGEDDKSNIAAVEQHNFSRKRKFGNNAHENTTRADHSEGPNCAVASQPSIAPTSVNLPPNIARAGGISHNVKVLTQSHGYNVINNAILPNGHANLSRAPATALPPFAGIGKRKQPPAATTHQLTAFANKNVKQTDMPSTASELARSQPSKSPLASNLGSNITSVTHHHNRGSTDNVKSHSYRSSSHFRCNGRSDHNIITFDYGSVSSTESLMHSNRGIEAHYHINEDDMILTDDVLMCPFIFRSREAVRYGALAECVQPGMLRAFFSPTSKLRSIEMIFDAMGFCQQLERASGNEGMAHIIPNSLEMALAPNSEEARVITSAESPFRIVYVNEPWTAITGYTQLDAEGKDLSILHQDHPGVRSSGGPPHEYENAAKGICSSGAYIQYDIRGREFLNFMCSYPLSNAKDEVTHILHVCKELPPRA